MNIQCDNCGTQHELDPPSWVKSSGRPFRFRCSACGSSQSVLPTAFGGERAAPAPSPPPAPQPTPTGGPPALPDTPVPTPTRTESPSGVDAGGVYLKQNGQIYSVRDWSTLERWITERRVDETDLVSEGGVRWEPIGSRPELAPLFAAAPPEGEARNPASNPPISAPTFPFAGDTPFGAPSRAEVWSDEDTEGIPLGLPPLPNGGGSFRADESEPEPPWSEPDPWADTVEPADLNTRFADGAADRPEPAEVPEGGVELGGPEPWELGLLESDPTNRPAVGEDDIDTPFGELRYEPTEEVFYSEEGFDAEEGPEDDAEAVPEMAEAEVEVEADLEVETEFLTPAPVERAPSRLEVVPSRHPSPAGASHEGTTPDGFAFDQSTGPGPDRLPPIEIPRTRLSGKEAAGRISPAGTVTQLRRPVPSGLSGPREAPTLEPLTEFPFDAEWEEEEAGRTRPSRWLLGVALVATFVALLVLAWFAGPLIGGISGPSVPPPTPVEGGAAASPDPASAEVEAQAEAPAPVLKPAPEHAADPVEAPAAPVEEPPITVPSESVAKLVKRGWDLADTDRPKAEKLFRRAVDLAPNDDEASYGYGYVLLLQGRMSEATKYLCRARKARRPDTRRDVAGLITNHGLKCP